MNSKATPLSTPPTETPAKYGYAMPAEWAAHEATWLSWPHNVETWPGKRLLKVRDIYLQMLEVLLDGEKVHLLVNHRAERDEVANFLRPKINMKNLILHEIPTVDAWIRDYGPTFVTPHPTNESPLPSAEHRTDPSFGGQGEGRVRARGGQGEGRKAWCKWIFNAWGKKYPPLMQDTNVFLREDLIAHPQFPLEMVLEGGSIEVNGAGVCLTTEQCLLNPNRNPSLSKKEIEQNLKNYLGVGEVVWLGEGILGDDTDGHIDDTARFAGERTVVLSYEEDERDENFRALHENRRRLEKWNAESGKKWDLIRLPMPGVVADGGVRLPASYANFYIANKALLLPIYGHQKDKKAAALLKELFPTREVVGIRCDALVYGLGAVHCVTQQEPA